MPSTVGFTLRPALPEDSACLAVLATQVFLDTYATDGIRADLAQEVLQCFSPAACEARLADPKVEITVAEAAGHLVGFLDLQSASPCPVPGIAGPEVLRLYIQAPFQRRGLGRMLLQHVEARVAAMGAPSLWLTAWTGNTQALAFYRNAGYRDVGTTHYIIEGKGYENRVYAKELVRAPGLRT